MTSFVVTGSSTTPPILNSGLGAVGRTGTLSVAPGTAVTMQSSTLFLGVANESGYGGDGNDMLRGGDGDDTLDGGLRSDTLIETRGDDSLLGGGIAADRFVLVQGNGNDLILDFANGVDKLDVHALGLTLASDPIAASHSIGSGRGAALYIDLTAFGGGSVILEGMGGLLDATDLLL